MLLNLNKKPKSNTSVFLYLYATDILFDNPKRVISDSVALLSRFQSNQWQMLGAISYRKTVLSAADSR